MFRNRTPTFLTGLCAPLMLAIAIGLTVELVGCGAMTPGSQSIPTATFNDKAAAAIQSVTLIRTSATALMKAGKITVDQDALIQQQLNIGAAGIKIAKSLQMNDPAAASAQLAASLATIDALKPQTGVNP